MTKRRKQMILANIAKDRTDITLSPMIVVEVIEYPRADRWGNVGTMEVTYDQQGHRAVYGFDSLARVSCYMD